MRKPPSLDDAIEAWVSDTQLLRNTEGAAAATETFLIADLRSPNTRKAYHQALRRFFIAAEAQEFKRLSAVTPIYVKRYLTGMTSNRGRASADKTRAQAYAALNHFFDAMVAAEILDRNPCTGVRIEVDKTTIRKTEAFSRKDYDQLLAHIGDDPLGLRDRALFSFLSHTAARIGAALKLQVKHLIDFEGERLIMLREKGRKPHMMPLTEGLSRDLAPYLDALGPTSPEDVVFRHWDPAAFRFTTDPLPYFEAQALLRARLANAKISKRLTFHSFRAGTITRMLEAGATLDEVQRMANHAQITTTQLYDKRDQNLGKVFGDKIDKVLGAK
jgi:integrase/recombinase XerD